LLNGFIPIHRALPRANGLNPFRVGIAYRIIHAELGIELTNEPLAILNIES